MAINSRLRILLVAVCGRAALMRTNRGQAFGDRSCCSARNASNSVGRELAVVLEHDRRHDLIAHLRVRHRVHRDLVDLRQPQQDPFYRCGGEVFAIDAHPVGGASRKVDPSLGIAVGEVADQYMP